MDIFVIILLAVGFFVVACILSVNVLSSRFSQKERDDGVTVNGHTYYPEEG